MMARHRSPLRARAYELWQKSGRTRTLKSIADELGVRAAQVRKWKMADAWGTDGAVQRKRGRGAPIGNRNAAGHGAPPGNTNALTHGAYSNVMLGFRDGDELAALTDKTTGADPAAEMRQMVAEINAQEIRIMKYIRRLQDRVKSVDLLEILSCVTSAGTDPANRRQNGSKCVCPIDAVAMLEGALDKAQGRKLAALMQLAQLDMSKAEPAQDDGYVWLEQLRRNCATDARSIQLQG